MLVRRAEPAVCRLSVRCELFRRGTRGGEPESRARRQTALVRATSSPSSPYT